MEKSHFLGDWWFFMWFLVILLVGTGEPPPYCNKNTLGKIGSKFGIGRPPPQLGQKPKFFQWAYLRAPLRPKLKYLGAMLVDPVRRQNFAGKLSIRFYNIWDCVISFNRTELDGLWYKCALKWGQTTVIGQKFVQRIGNVLQACLWMGSNWVNDSWLAGRRSRPPAKQTFCSPSHSSLAWINLDKIISKLEV